MPELPFITVLVENLGHRVTGRRITKIVVKSPSILKTYDPPLETLKGRTIIGVQRRGKVILLGLDQEGWMVIHLMRHGRIQLGPSRAPTKDLALAITLDDGQEIRCLELGPKKQAALYLVRESDLSQCPPLVGLGLDPLDPALTPQRLAEMLHAERGQLKRFLTLQRHLAGIGNAFSDEILWHGQLSPFAPAASLSDEEVARLHDAIQPVMRQALEEHREHFGEDLPMKEPPTLLRVHRKGGSPCPRCGTPIAVVYFADRETYYCPTCQTKGKVYADRRLSRLRR